MGSQGAEGNSGLILLDTFADNLKEMQRFFKILPVVLFFGLLAFPPSAFCQVDTAWVHRYNGPGDTTDQANAIAVDIAGNVYVTGSSYGLSSGPDITTIKYDAQGNQLWLQRYNGTGNSYDHANVLVIDNHGNIYVAGNSYGLGSMFDLIIIKYDASGNELWVRRYNGPGNGHDGATSIALDSNNCLYVTGYSLASSEGMGIDYEYVTIKYDSAGNQLWLANYNAGNYLDIATSIVVAPGGFVYVTGYSTDSVTNEDFATIKYDLNGNQSWVRRYSGPGPYYDEPYSVKTNAKGEAFVAGWSGTGPSTSEFATVKYDTAGNQLWDARYDVPFGSHEQINALAVNGQGDVYVAGFSQNTGGISDMVTVKYDSSGNLVWSRVYNGPENGSDLANSVAVDSFRNVYVSGSGTGVGTSTDYTTIKYDSLGSQLWVKTYDGPTNSLDEARAMAIDAKGNVYVTGRSIGSTKSDDYDYATIKYSPLPALKGDLNLDGVLTMVDVVLMLNFTFTGDRFPAAPAAGDFNCDGKISPADVVIMLQIFFLSAPPPC